jgi:hypothetical protein
MWYLFWQCQRSSEQRRHESVQNDKQALVVLIIARAFYLGLRLRLVALLFAFACALSGHSTEQASHAGCTGLHRRYSGVMRALLAWPPK